MPAENGPEAALVGELEVICLESLDQLAALAAGEWAPAPPEPMKLLLEPAGRRARPCRPAWPASPALRARGGRRRRPQPADGRPAGSRQVAGGKPAALDPAAAGARGGARGGADRQRLRAAGRRGQAGGRPFRCPAPHGQPGRTGRRRQPARARGRRRLPTAACSSSTSSASFAATPSRHCGRRLETGWVSIARAGVLAPPALSLHAGRRGQSLPLRARRGRSRVHLSAARRASLPGPAQRRARRSHRHPRRDPSAERRGDRRAVRGALGRRARASGSPLASARKRRLGRRSLQRRDDAGGGAGLPARRRAAASLLAESYSRRRLSGRAHDRVLRLARTIADLAGAETIDREQMAQALQLRRRDQQ